MGIFEYLNTDPKISFREYLCSYFAGSLSLSNGELNSNLCPAVDERGSM